MRHCLFIISSLLVLGGYIKILYILDDPDSSIWPQIDSENGHNIGLKIRRLVFSSSTVDPNQSHHSIGWSNDSWTACLCMQVAMIPPIYAWHKDVGKRMRMPSSNTKFVPHHPSHPFVQNMRIFSLSLSTLIICEACSWALHPYGHMGCCYADLIDKKWRNDPVLTQGN